MNPPIWVEARLAFLAHQKVIEQHGGADGIRDAGLLDGALQRPQMAYFYDDPTPDIIDLSAIYFIAVSDAQAFIEGNKRTGSAVCHLFLRMNGFRFGRHDRDERVEVFVKAGNHRETGFGQAELSGWIRRHVVAI